MGSTVDAMPHFGNLPAHVLTDAIEKHVAKMEDADLAAILARGIGAMPRSALHALVASIFDAFRDRGESSDDVAEGSRVPLESIEDCDLTAVAALIAYAAQNTSLLKESLTLFAEGHGDELSSLPKPILDGVSERLHV
ncbi:MAG: hypothetical protein M3R51_04070 [Candidatus Eremiobacteraeota bacterium]|nr:hypothetical protein [Candidatus Eremiobacteraeota bacterium]